MMNPPAIYTELFTASDTMTLIVDLTATTLVIFALTIVCRTWGRAAFKLLGVELAPKFDHGELWVGFSVLLAAIEFLHLFVPIDWKVSLLIFALGLLPFAKQAERNLFLSDFKRYVNFTKSHYIKVCIVIAIALLWCMRAMGIPNHFDSGLYHFGSIRWLNEHAIVPGLANLHWRLGLNQSYFGFLSLVNFFPVWNKGYATGGLFLIYLTALTVFKMALSQPLAWRWIFGGILFIYLGSLAATLPNPTPDTAVGLLEIVVFCFLFQIVQNRLTTHNQAGQCTQSSRDTVIVLLLCLSLVTIKLSSVAFAVSSMMVAIYFYFMTERTPLDWTHQRHGVLFKLLLWMTGISTLHILRGYLLSGAPLFPSTFAGAWGLDWAIPKEFAAYEANLIYSWARYRGEISPEQILGYSGWISGWLKSFSLFQISWMAIATILMLLNIILGYCRKANTINRNYLILYLPISASFIFWFLTAPDVRFLGAVAVLYIALSVWLFSVLIAERYMQAFEKIFSRKQVYSWIAAFIICLFSLKLTGLSNLSVHGWPEIPRHPFNTEKTLTDLPINVPTINAQCWDAPLPCASVFNGNLHADPIHLPWPLSILNIKRFFYSVKFLNLTQ